jgi:UDP-N-acetylglucosamine--N-acetylmuramyl-(pentapeptide) pyrophosphoryl-undecaprenol N-acetylglucosamine transferase
LGTHEMADLKKENIKPSNRRLKLIIAGGGTGGHIFPGLAVGKEILKRHPSSEIIFVTGDKKIEGDILKDAGIKRVSITVEGIKGRGLIKRIRAAIKLPYGLFQSLSIIKRFSPDMVLGVGGYSAGPVCLAAWMMGVKTAIHEQNSYPGVTNRLLSRIADRVFVSFRDSGKYFPRDKVRVTGNPIREQFLTGSNVGKGPAERFTILVTGGSQGASAINMIFIMALKKLKEKGLNPLVIHQTGQAGFEEAVQNYRENGLEGDIKPFIQDMSAAYGKADIVIGRAGAGTVFELAVLGKPSILIPFPQAADDHQTSNARMLSDAGGAIMIPQDELDADRLADVLAGFMEDRTALQKMAEHALRTARPNAAKEIADQMEELLSVR